MSVVYVLTTPIPEDGGENPTVEQVKKRTKWDNGDYVYRGLILNDASSKKFIVSNFTNYKMTDSRPVLKQYNELLGILRRFTQHKINMDESIQVSCMIDKLSPSWKYFKNTLKHLKEELTLVELGSHLRIKESLRAQDNDKPKGKNVGGPLVVNMVEHNNSSRKPKHLKKDCKAGNIGNKANGSGTKASRDGSSISLKDRCWFKTYKSLNDESILHIGNESTALVHRHGCVDIRFSSVPRPSLRIPNGTEDIGGSVVPEKVTKEVVQTRDEVSDQHSYCFNVEDDPKTFDEAMKSQDVVANLLVANGFSKENGSTIRLLITITSIHKLIIHQMDVKTNFLNDELDEEVYMNQPQGFIMHGNENKVDLTKEFLSSRFSMKDIGEVDVILGIRIKHESNGISISQSHYLEKVLKKFNYFDCTLVSTPIDTSGKLMPNNGQAVSQLKYSRVIGCLMYAMTCTRHDIAFAVGKLSMYTSNPGTQHWQAIQRVLKYLKKTMDYRLTYTSYLSVLEADGKEAQWLRNLILEILLWSKPITSISIHCDSDATLAKAYSQMYNGKSRYLGVRHSMIRELITNRVVSIEFVRSQQNLADHLTKGLARDLVIKSAEGMGLKST
ncbi:zinc finger, CCHC-type containing protein [Tanacetum coccineum]